MKKIKTFMLSVAIAVLTSCGTSLTGGSEDVYYETSSGDRIPAVTIDAPDGRTIYAVRLPAMSYQQAYAMQRDGWVLPRMYGAKAYDEHRTTTMPTMELLLEEHLPALNADASSVCFQAVDGELKRLMDDNDQTEQNYWTSTRTPQERRLWNYVLGYNKSTGTCEYKIAGQEETKDVILLKDAAVLTDTITDQDYRIGDGRKMTGELYKAVDGYDYYVVTLRDSMYTWLEAVAMERDGWVMPCREGKTLEVAPTLEGLLGNHPIHSSMALTKQMKHLFPISMWTSSVYDAKQAYLLGSNIFAANTIGMYIENKRTDKIGAVTLVKRVPAQTDQQYTVSNNFYAQAREVEGMSGSVYYVVDPSGWHGTTHNKDNVRALEKDGWHILTLDEFNDMLGLTDENAAVMGTHWPKYNHPLFHYLFSAGNVFYATLENGDLIQIDPYYHTYAQAEWGLSVHGVFRDSQVLLVKTDDSKTSAEAITANDQQMYALKGKVYQIYEQTYGTSYGGGNEYYPTSSIDKRHIAVSFNKNGLITQDHLSNIYRYAKDGTFRSGNHDYSKVTRDKQNRIISYNDSKETDDESNYEVKYSYDEKGRLSKVSYSGWTTVYETVYRYSDQDQLASAHSTGTFEGGGEYESSEEYRYTKFDEQGNWTQRFVTKNYTEKNVDGVVEEDAGQNNVVVCEERTISYFK